MSTIINVAPETHELAKRLAQEQNCTLREITANALEAYAKQSVVTAATASFLMNVEEYVLKNITTKLRSTMQEALTATLKEIRELEAYKPWLKQDHADDIEELEAEVETESEDEDVTTNVEDTDTNTV